MIWRYFIRYRYESFILNDDDDENEDESIGMFEDSEIIEVDEINDIEYLKDILMPNKKGNKTYHIVRDILILNKL